MKNSFLVLGGILFLINTTIGLIFSSYNPFNMVMVDISILLSTALIYGAYISKMADGFKIGFTVLFAITGLIRFVCSVVSPEQFKDNMAFLVFIIFLAIEGLSFFVGNSLKNK
ncbi:hypothetical protein N8329_02090 [Crocinitomicaceae bacterium]|nr:hypothetical protein [Crocinitomicaceae bacterium]